MATADRIPYPFIRTVRAELLDRFTAVGAFCDRGQIRLNFHETGDPFAHQ